MTRTWDIGIFRRRSALQRFAREESGTTLIELAMVISIFLALFFIILDFGRMASEYVFTEKAVQRAARIATVRPPLCTGLPSFQQPASGVTPAPKAGTFCRAGACEPFAARTCTGDLTNETFQEIWFGSDRAAGGVPGIREMLPRDAVPANFVFRYAPDPNLGFVGGPISGVVTVGLNEAAGSRLLFRSVFPLHALLGLSGANASAADDVPRQEGIPFPILSVSLPSEDLSHR
jgi:hypothetical protein